MKQQKQTIDILGAGISGLSASILLSEFFNVAVHEKSPSIEAKPLHISAVRNYGDEDVLQKAEKIGVRLKPSKSIYQIHRFSPHGFSSTSYSKTPILYMFDRGGSDASIEQQLYKQASARGIKVLFNSRKRDADIIATGPSKSNADIFCFGMRYKGELDDVYMFYDTRYAPRGYISVLPSRNEFQVCIVSLEKHVAVLRKMYEEVAVRLPILRDLTAKSRRLGIVEGIGSYFKPVGYRDSRYYIGEAGGFQDPSRGFGIWNAIFSAQLAVKSILEKCDFNELIEQSYMEEYRSNLVRRREFDKLDNEGLDRMILGMGTRIELQQYLRKRV